MCPGVEPDGVVGFADDSDDIGMPLRRLPHHPREARHRDRVTFVRLARSTQDGRTFSRGMRMPVTRDSFVGAGFSRPKAP